MIDAVSLLVILLRIGQKDKVTYIDLMVPESLDVMIMSALDRKIKLSAQTLGEEAKRFLS